MTGRHIYHTIPTSHIINNIAPQLFISDTQFIVDWCPSLVLAQTGQVAKYQFTHVINR